MNVKITEAGLEYLEKKQHKVITLEIKTSGGGCCPTFEMEEIYFNPPKNLDKFNEFEINNLKVFIDKKAKVITPTLQFDAEKKLFFTDLIVKGLSLKKQD